MQQSRFKSKSFEFQYTVKKEMLKRLIASVFSRENMLALALALIVLALVIFTADTTPDWIYQGF
jgi:lipopolysaccharide/colanic/teichoic acid biosynthesis glycosyltransferase